MMNDVDDDSKQQQQQMDGRPRKRVRGIHQLTPHMFDHLSSAPIAIIDQITFGLLNPAHLVAISACEVTEFTLYKKQLPAQNSANDTTMGASDSSTLCRTCDEPIATCQGHMGHIVLEAPCYAYSWIKSTCQALSAVCFHCSKLLINRKSAKFRNISRLINEKERLAALADVGKKSKRCGIYTQSQMRALKAEEALEAEEKAAAAASEETNDEATKKTSRNKKKVSIKNVASKKKTVDILNDESICGWNSCMVRT
jgi:DNA-directed RNA polymerase beta' subunit